MPTFDVKYSRTLKENESDKKYVLYSITINQDYADPNVIKPSIIERRYTDFHNLYNNLRKEHPTFMNGVNFPNKVVMGNFDPGLILSRSNSFIVFLEHIAKEMKLRESPHTVEFFQGVELSNAKRFIEEGRCDQAVCLLENNFKLLNKIYLDRSHVVLIALCRLVACGAGGASTDPVKSAALAGPIEQWAVLALRRFQAVSDTDLLSLYVPLIKTCISIWKVLGKDSDILQNDLDRMKKRGMKVDTCVDLFKAVEELEGSLNVS